VIDTNIMIVRISVRVAISVTSVRRSCIMSIVINKVGGAMIETIICNAGSVRVAFSVTSVRRSGIRSIIIKVGVMG
jgi:hypothetical protein